MSKVSLFEISKDHLELIELVEQSIGLDGEINEFAQAALVLNKEEFAVKAGNYIAVIDQLESDLDRAKKAAEQIKAFVDRKTKTRDFLKERLKDAVELMGPVEIGFAKLSLRKSDETIIHDMSKIPEEYLSRKEVISADKNKIKKDIKAGKEVPGAEVISKNNLQIK